MSRFSRIAAAAAFLTVSGTIAACAQTEGAQSNAGSAQNAQPTQAAPAAPTYSDAQLQSFVAAREEIQQLTPGQTTEQQQQNQIRISQILQSNNIDANTYNAIATASRSDQALSNRIAALVVGDEFTDAQLQSFVTASAQIQPLSQQLATATPDQRTVLAQQIRATLEQNNLSLEVYNGIAAQAQSDQDLAARIAALQAGASEDQMSADGADDNGSDQAQAQ